MNKKEIIDEIFKRTKYIDTIRGVASQLTDDVIDLLTKIKNLKIRVENIDGEHCMEAVLHYDKQKRIFVVIDCNDKKSKYIFKWEDIERVWGDDWNDIIVIRLY